MTQLVDLGGNTLITENIRVGATAPGQSGTDISSSEIAVLDGVTAGQALASKAVVLGASKEIATITTATITTVNAVDIDLGSSGAVGTVDIFPTTAASGKTRITAANNAGDTTTTITNASQSGARTYTIPDAGASASFVLSTGTSTGVAVTSTEFGVLASATNANSGTGKAVILGTSGAVTLPGLVTLNGGTTHAAGTNTVPPIQLVTGTNLSTAVNGAIEFDGAAYYGTSNGSTKQGMIDVAQYIIQATEPTADNNTGLDTNAIAAFFTASNGAVTLVSGKTYMFEGIYMLTNTGTTAHTWATAFGGAATFTATGTNYQAWGTSGGTAGTAATGGAQGFVAGFTATGATTKILAVTPSSTSATEQVMICVAGTLVCANGGTLIPSLCASARPGASGTPGVLHKAGSFFKIWQVPTLGTVGNWS